MLGGDQVTKGMGKALGLPGATLSGLLQLLLPVQAYRPGERPLMYRPPHDHHGLCLQVAN